ncbi:MAG: hypothetical protein WCC53_15915, partial [Thermoanaerobaculia bacterium]
SWGQAYTGAEVDSRPMSDAPSAPVETCFLCSFPASVSEEHPLFASSLTGVSVDCEECGAYAITPDAIHRLSVRPVARPGVRFEIFRLRSNGRTPRPTVDLKMVEHFCTGYTPMRG